MKSPRTVKRRAKTARRAGKVAVTAATSAGAKSKTDKPPRSTLDNLESVREDARTTRLMETMKRNAAAQQLPRATKRRKTSSGQSEVNTQNLETDAKDFFAAIDAPLFRICGGCGELANAALAVRRLFDPVADFFSPLQNEDGIAEVIDTGLVIDSADGKTFIWLCDRCYRALRARQTPKFSRCTGFRIGCVPEVLARLNRMEARLIGLGVSFTTCVNLYRDGQEFTRGNAINYWNEPGQIVRELPRPLRACGVVFLATASDKTTKYFRVRPDLVRQALRWLIAHNPLYGDITISEDNLRALEQIDADRDVPSIQVSAEEAQELQGQVRPVNETENNRDGVLAGDTGASTTLATAISPPIQNTQGDESSSERSSSEKATCGESTSRQRCGRSACATINENIRSITAFNLNRADMTHYGVDSSGYSHACASSNVEATKAASVDLDFMEHLNESFELEGNQNCKQSELEKVMSAVGMDATNTAYPVGELKRCENPIDEYNTQQLMQSCFPTLFPDGRGGYHPMNASETREHEYTLTEYCAHLMKWHDRRFVIHGNFKFFCLDLIQRRQIDGLVRRVSVTDSREEAIRTARSGTGDNGTLENDAVNSEKLEMRTAMQILDSLKPFFRVVRGSGLYWSNARDDLMAMMGNRVLPTRWPTLFLTLSAADTIWPDFARACNPALTLDECQNLSFVERRRYLVENPDISARHFNRRFQAFFDLILCGKAKPLGEITDHFWRVEFQQRGSPHIHCLLWIKDAPDVLKLSESEDGRNELATFVDKRISVLSKKLSELEVCSCETCSVHREGKIDILAMRPPPVDSEDWQCDLSRVVQRVQQHVCNAESSCRKKSSECRFGYPKELHPCTNIETSSSLDGTPTLKVHLKRYVSSINNYSPHLLSNWRANMDLQLIGNSFGAAEYAGAYVSKAEPDTLRFRRIISKAVRRCDPNLPYHSILKRVANATLSVREVGAPEAIYTLLRSLPMYSKSRTVQKVKVLRHDKRFYRVDPHGLQELAELATASSTETIRLERVERGYMNRPATPIFDTMSLATFVENYALADSVSEKADSGEFWKRLDGEGYIKHRAKSVVVQKSPWMKPNPEDADFCFSEVFLYIPWRSLDSLPATDAECIERFLSEQETVLDSELKEESNVKIDRQQKLDLLRKSPEACVLSTLPPSQYVFISSVSNENEPSTNQPDTVRQKGETEWHSKHAYSPEVVTKAVDFLNLCLKPWMKEKRDARKFGGVFTDNAIASSRYRYPIDGHDDPNSAQEAMADSQWIPFSLAMKQSRDRLKCSLEQARCTPLRMIVNGEGGSGKSWLIKHIVKDVHNVFGEHKSTRRTSKRVLLLAHQGTAAFNIKGMTICSALAFASFSRSAFSVPYKSLASTKSGPTRLRSMQKQFKDVHLVIIDEFSVISCGMLYWIDNRMREIWPNHSDEPFGGRDVYFTGDAAQLDPVVPSALATPLTKICNLVQRRGRELWESIEHVCMLTSQNRGKRDPEWFAALRRLRMKVPTAEDVALFNSRCVQPDQQPPYMATAKHIAHKNVDVDAANDERIDAANAATVHITSQHFVQQKRLATKRDIPAGTVNALLKDAKNPNSDRDRVVSSRLKLCVGAPVTLTYNMAQSAGLCNGTNGIVYDFMFLPDSELPVVLVQITDTYLGPSLLNSVANIVPIAPKEVSWGKNSSDLRVVRKGTPLRLAYAMTVHKVQGLTCKYVVFHSNSIPNVAFAYVALSRITHRNSIVVTHRLSIDKLTTTPAKTAEFARENERVEEAVARTVAETVSTVHAMQAIALAHNEALSPR